MRGIDHLDICRSPVFGQRPEQIFPDAPLCPTGEPIINRRRRALFGRAIAPSAAALEHMNDAADDAAVINPFNPADIRRQVRLHPCPLLIAEPK